MSPTVIAPVRVPLAVGAKLTLIVQLEAAVSELPQVLVCVKSLAWVPVTAMLAMLKGALPVLVRMIVCAALAVPTPWLGKVKLAGARLTAGSATTPVPRRMTICGLAGASSEMLSVPLRVPLPVGVKETLIVQLLPTATLVPQLFVWVKSPLTAKLEIVTTPLPVLVRVMTCAPLELPVD